MSEASAKDAGRAPLERLLRPRSVAIFGVSDKPGALGNQVLANQERHGFEGDIHLVNPSRDSVGGRPCVRSAADLPHGVDTAVLAIPGAAVLQTLSELAEIDVGAAIIFSAGFAEGGEAGRTAQARIVGIAEQSGMVVLGPNCLGLTNYVGGVPLTFVQVPPLRLEGRPGVGVVSQSGAMAVVLGTTLMSKGLGMSCSVSTGNEAACGVEDFVEHLIGDPATAAIAMIVEQFRNPRRFLVLAERARAAGKPVLLLHPGRSIAAAASAATHTGAMAGDWQVMRCKVAHAGVVLAESLEELGDVVDLAVRCGPMTGATAVLTESGAFKALALDLCDEIGLDLPAPAEATAQALRAAVPDFIPVSNPMDLTAQSLVDPDLYRRAMTPFLADEAYGSVVLGIIQTDEATARLKFEPIIDAVRALRPAKPVIFAGLDEGASTPAAYVEALRGMNVPYFPSPERAFRAIARWVGRRAASGPEETPITVELLTGGGVIAEYRAKQILAAHGAPFPRAELAADLDGAKWAARRLGYPVALKAQAQALAHKSDAGGVVLGVDSDAALAAAWDRMHADLARHAPGLALDGVLVEAMARRGVELIVGARNDPDWGAVILVGFGGVQAEILKDVRLMPAGLPRDAIAAELRQLKSGALLDGWRGAPPLDVDALADIAALLGRIVLGTPAIREIDLNPVVVFPVGQGVLALDALIVCG